MQQAFNEARPLPQGHTELLLHRQACLYEVDVVASITVPNIANLSALNNRVGASPLISMARCHALLQEYCKAECSLYTPLQL